MAEKIGNLQDIIDLMQQYAPKPTSVVPEQKPAAPTLIPPPNKQIKEELTKDLAELTKMLQALTGKLTLAY